jgi:hypothetical protein
MPPPPASLPATPSRWATNTGARDPDPLPVGLVATGWLPGNVVPARALNSLEGLLSDWIVYMSDLFPATGQMGLTRLDLYDGPLPSGQLASTLTVRTYVGLGGVDVVMLRHEDTPAAVGIGMGSADGNQATLLIQGSNDRATMIDLTTGDEHWYSDSTIGINASAGIQADDDADGGRYRYPAGNEYGLIHRLGPAYGGWSMLHKTLLAAPVLAVVGVAGRVGLLNTSGTSQDGSYRRHLDVNPTGGGCATYAPTITGLSGIFAVAGVSDMVVRLIQADNAGTETTIATVTGAAPNWTGSVQMVPGRDYYVELYAAGLGGSALTSQDVRDVVIVLDHGHITPGV